MEIDYVTTPFGRRTMSLGQLKTQRQAETGTTEPARNKWKLFRAVCEARAELGISDRALTVLDALLSFYPDDELSRERGLIVFPSNAQLSIRARGMTAATLRRHLSVLIEAGLISRKDSPNGKRYARRGREGQIHDAYGFSLVPLLSRASQIEAAAAQAIADRELLRVTKERISICRRDITKLIGAAIEDHIAGNWECVFANFRALIDGIPRTATIDVFTPILIQLEKVRERIIKQLEIQINLQNLSANESQIERHKQDSNSKSLSESERPDAINPSTSASQPASPIYASKDGERTCDKKISDHQQPHPTVSPSSSMKSLPLSLVLQACPQIADYAPGGIVRTWRDLMAAAIVVHTMLRVSPTAYQEASHAMGPEITATIMACLLERGTRINSAGGYLRDLTRRAERGEFAVGPMLMALLRTNKNLERHAG